MKSKTAIWTFSGLFLAAMMVAVLGFAGVGATSQKVSSANVRSLANASDTGTPQADIGNRSREHQTVRVFWPIWSGQR